MRLIDVDALIEKHCECCSEDIRNGCKTDPVCGTLMWLEEAPTIDAVPVVRCKDCKYCSPYLEECGATTLYCRKHYSIAELVIPYDFCSYGERKDGEA